jgi:hypothetical protein
MLTLQARFMQAIYRFSFVLLALAFVAPFSAVAAATPLSSLDKGKIKEIYN